MVSNATRASLEDRPIAPTARSQGWVQPPPPPTEALSRGYRTETGMSIQTEAHYLDCWDNGAKPCVCDERDRTQMDRPVSR